MSKAFIEDFLPIQEISYESAKEKYLTRNNISKIHVYWARRPLSVCRSIAYASLVPITNNKNKTIHNIIALSQRKCLDENILKDIRQEIQQLYKYPPKTLDPFAGGGSIPLELARLGCESYAIDYNPLATLIEKCTLEYPCRYKESLINDLRYYSTKLLDNVKNEILQFYQHNSAILHYIWIRIIRCPKCNTELPLLRSFWLKNKHKNTVILYPKIIGTNIIFDIIYNTIPPSFNPDKGTVTRQRAICLNCHNIITRQYIKELFKLNKVQDRLAVIILYDEKHRKLIYKIPTENDINLFNQANKYLEIKINDFLKKWNYNPIPFDKIPDARCLGIHMQLYNFQYWSDLFNARQKLLIITFIDKINSLKTELQQNYDKEYSKVIITYLAFLVSKILNINSIFTHWDCSRETSTRTFAHHTLPFYWDYVETNIFGKDKYNIYHRVSYYISSIHSLTKITDIPPIISSGSATQLQYSDNFFDLVFTDPPYYDNIDYASLSNFFYVWLHKILSDLYPELFSSTHILKEQQIIADTSYQNAKDNFEQNLTKAFQEIYRVLKPQGLSIIEYASKSDNGWISFITALINSNFRVSKSWCILTELDHKKTVVKSGFLRSSVFFICRKSKENKNINYPNLLSELKKYLTVRISELWNNDITGADLYNASIGCSMEIFTKYNKITDKDLTSKDILTIIKSILREIWVENIINDLTPITKFYVLWKYNFTSNKVHIDKVKTLASSINLTIDDLIKHNIINVSTNYASLIKLFNRDINYIKQSTEMIDVLHYILLLWKNKQLTEILYVLKNTYKSNDIFYKLIQSLIHCTSDKKELQLLESFLQLNRKSELLQKIESIIRL